MSGPAKFVAVAPDVIVDCDYLTPNKRYPIVRQTDTLFWIDDDIGDRICCAWEACAHLQLGDWVKAPADVVGAA